MAQYSTRRLHSHFNHCAVPNQHGIGVIDCIDESLLDGIDLTKKKSERIDVEERKERERRPKSQTDQERVKAKGVLEAFKDQQRMELQVWFFGFVLACRLTVLTLLRYILYLLCQ